MFKYMDEYYLEPNQSVKQKFLKVYEEFDETLEIFQEGNCNSDRAQEVLDLILSSVNLLRKMQHEDLIDIGTETFKHSLKLNKYLETGKYKK
ncbi:MAG: hypothetical protein ACRDAS_00550 [Cetobacterium sp.]